MTVSSVTADGKKLAVRNQAVVLPSNAKEVQISWQKKSDAPALNYANAVQDYKAEYRRRYEQWVRTGNNQSP